LVFNSLGLENDVIYAWACVPFTGILNIFPASKLLVTSNPPVKKQLLKNALIYDVKIFTQII